MRQSILNLIRSNSVVVEVGVWKGDFSAEILARGPKQLILVDPWKSYPDLNGRWYATEQLEMDAIHDAVVKRFNGDSRVTIERKASIDYKPSTKLDLVYIDANHSYDYVKQDLEHWWPHIAVGGYMTGDDWGWKDKNCSKGPTPAIKEFCEKHKLTYTVEDRSQWIIKKEY